MPRKPQSQPVSRSPARPANFHRSCKALPDAAPPRASVHKPIPERRTAPHKPRSNSPSASKRSAESAARPPVSRLPQPPAAPIQSRSAESSKGPAAAASPVQSGQSPPVPERTRATSGKPPQPVPYRAARRQTRPESPVARQWKTAVADRAAREYPPDAAKVRAAVPRSPDGWPQTPATCR